MPSAFSMTFGVVPSITATHEFVVPRSMPMTLPISASSRFRQAGRAGEAPGAEGPCGRTLRPRTAPPAPIATVSPRRGTTRSPYRRGFFCLQGGTSPKSSGLDLAPVPPLSSRVSQPYMGRAGASARGDDAPVASVQERPRPCGACDRHAAALLLASSPARTADAVFPPASRLGLAPPPGFVVSSNFLGFQHSDKQATIIMAELPGYAFETIEKEVAAELKKDQAGSATRTDVTSRTAAASSCSRNPPVRRARS